jgi:S-DNA-T family DNA segregation ATPase FtsK/SpoIIIE
MGGKRLLTSKRFRELAGVVLFTAAVLILMSIASYDADDPSYFTYNESPAAPRNVAGPFGATLAAALFQTFGLSAYLVPLLLGAAGIVWFTQREWEPAWWRAAGSLSALFGLTLLADIAFGSVSLGGASAAAGGAVGSLLVSLLRPHLALAGTAVVGLLLVVLGVLGATHWSLAGIGRVTGVRAQALAQHLTVNLHRLRDGHRRERLRQEVLKKHAQRREAMEPVASISPTPASRPAAAAPDTGRSAEPKLEAIEPVPPPRRAVGSGDPPRRSSASSPKLLPPLDLLNAPAAGSPIDRQDLEDKARLIVERCAEFGVAGVVTEIHPGPVVTTFEFRPEPGIKYSRVTGLTDDLALALRAESILIDRIPGKSTVGIEVPNRHRETISLREILLSSEFQEHPSKLRLGLGRGVEGKVHVADLAEMPHLLIAGSTGSGKSVTLNALITSLLYTASPEEVKFIMVDTKRLELGIYEHLPHLISPVVTEAKKAANALRWAVVEMEKRYKTLADGAVRNIAQHNRAIEVAAGSRKPRLDPSGVPLKPLPYIVVIIDELADLMLTSAREVEESIMRLAQMARAVGIHLILSTQRPSVDVITGVIKANLPSRMALRVASKVDSRTIMDSNGAERLLGMGDMLFVPPRSSRMIRIHGPFLSEGESLRLVEYLRAKAEPIYDHAVTADPQEEMAPGGGDAVRDDMYQEALRVVVESRQASTSQLQRRLRLGFARAGRLMDMLEADGIVGPQDGSKAREVLVGPDYLREFLAERRD